MLNFLILVIVLATHSTFTLSSCDVDPITYFLNNQIIKVPDSNILVSGNNYLQLRQTTCSQFQYTNINSSYQPLMTIPIEFNGISFECNGDYSYTFLKGKIKSSLSKLSLSMAATFNKSQPLELPNGLSINSCKVSNAVVKISFNGGNVIAKDILNTISEVLRTYIENQIKTKLCNSLVPVLEGNITNYLKNQVDPQLTAIIESTSSNVPPSFLNMSTYINWNSTINLVNTIRHCIDVNTNTYSNPHTPFVGATNKPISAMASSSFIEPTIQTNLINKLMGFIIDSTGSLSLPFNYIIPIQSAYLSINSLTIVGLDTFTDVDVLSPSYISDISIHRTTKLSNLSLILNMTYQAQPAIQCYNESLQLKIQLSDLVFSHDTSIAMNKYKLKSYGLYKILNTGCLLSTIEYFNLSSLNVKFHVSSIQLLQIKGSATHYEKEISYLMNNIFLLLTTGYSKFLTEFITGLFQGIIRHKINEMLTENIITYRQNFPCNQVSVSQAFSNIKNNGHVPPHTSPSQSSQSAVTSVHSRLLSNASHSVDNNNNNNNNKCDTTQSNTNNNDFVWADDNDIMNLVLGYFLKDY